MITLSSEEITLVIQILGVALFSILFLQSGIDKLVDWKGNLYWLTGHFADSPLAKVVPLLLGVITIAEITAGVACGYGIIEMLLFDRSTFAVLGVILSLTNILMLFTGQRLAKDYPGAAVLVGYFLLAIVLLHYMA